MRVPPFVVCEGVCSENGHVARRQKSLGDLFEAGQRRFSFGVVIKKLPGVVQRDEVVFGLRVRLAVCEGVGLFQRVVDDTGVVFKIGIAGE